MDGCTALTSLVIWVLFCASRVSLSSTTGMTQPFKYSLSYLYSYCQTGGRLAFGTRNISYCTLHPAILEKFQTHVTLLQRVLGGIEKVGPLWGPHPPEFGGFILLLVIQLEQKKTQRIIFFFGVWGKYSGGSSTLIFLFFFILTKYILSHSSGTTHIGDVRVGLLRGPNGASLMIDGNLGLAPLVELFVLQLWTNATFFNNSFLFFFFFTRHAVTLSDHLRYWWFPWLSSWGFGAVCRTVRCSLWPCSYYTPFCKRSARKTSAFFSGTFFFVVKIHSKR